MSVAFARAVIDGLRYNGVPLRFEPGWERRGNGQSFPPAGPDGSLTHHTGANFDGGYGTLIHGRRDLPGPLCNSSGWADGSISIIAAHPANHAGAAGGSWARPFPDTRNFNRLVWGHEIMFPGTRPWTPAQYRSARVLAAVVIAIRRRGPEWARAHYETSVTGKWDPGVGNGRHEPFPFNRFRAELWAALQEGDMDANQDRMLREIHQQLFGPWETWRFGTGGQERRSLVDLVRGIDLELVSRIDLAGRPGPEADTMLGQDASIRADVRALRAQLDRIERALPKAQGDSGS